MCRPCTTVSSFEGFPALQGKAFAATGHVMRSLEAVAVAASQQEPVLLVGETGTGKTTLVQHLAEQVGFLPALRAPLGVACSKPVSLMMLQHAIASCVSPAHKMCASWLSC